MICEMKNRKCTEAIFGGWQETIIWSCLQGVMGKVYINDSEQPTAAMAILGDFCFFAGTPCRGLVEYKPCWCKQDFMIAVPQSEEWADLIEQHYGHRAERVTRYAMKKEPDIFDRDRLRQIVEALPSEYAIRQIDREIFDFCKKHSWCQDWVGQFADYSLYEKMGVGVAIVKDGVPLSGASSYSVYQGGIEIQINTQREYRRKGLALACGASLILECLARDLYPSWDAQNLQSVALAEKLGYHFDHAYSAYEITGYGNWD